MLEAIGGAVGLVTGAVAAATVFYARLRKVRKEALDVVELARNLAEKYAQVDDDARKLTVEIAEFIASAKELRKGFRK